MQTKENWLNRLTYINFIVFFMFFTTSGRKRKEIVFDCILCQFHSIYFLLLCKRMRRCFIGIMIQVDFTVQSITFCEHSIHLSFHVASDRLPIDFGNFFSFILFAKLTDVVKQVFLQNWIYYLLFTQRIFCWGNFRPICASFWLW